MSRNPFLPAVALLCVMVLSGAAAPSSPVADAAMRRDVATLRASLAAGAEVNAAHGDGMTGLHWAARNGDAEAARVLLDAGADPEAVTRVGRHTPLHVASTFGGASVVGSLLEAGSDANATTTTGATPLHFAATSGSAEAVALLLDHGADVNAREPRWGQTPLMFAAAGGRVDAIRALLEWSADPRVTAKVVDIAAREEADKAENKAREARIAALRGTESESDETESGADKTPRLTQEEREAAAEEADLQEEPEPLGYARLVGTHGGLTALLLAAREGHADAVLALLEGGADLDEVSAADGTTPLLIATINGHFDLAMMLLERGASVTAANAAGGTPLYAAVNTHWIPKSRHPQPTDSQQQRVNHLELMMALIEAGADPNARLSKSLWFTTFNTDQLGVDRTGATPFWRAAYALDIPAMRLLLTHGADPALPTTRVPERRFRTGLGDDDTDYSGLPPVPFGGPAVHPIHAASGVGYGQGFAANSHRHVPDGWLPAMKFLVEELGADVNARDHNGYTAVHHAAARGDNALIQYLVEKGADVTAVSRQGITTVDIANGPVQRTQPFPETIVLLESLGAKNNHNCVSC